MIRMRFYVATSPYVSHGFRKKFLPEKSPLWGVKDRVRVRLGIGLGLESEVGRGAAFFRGGFFPRTVSHNIGSALLISNPWFSNKKSLTLFKLGETFISNFLPTIKAVGRQKAFALSVRGFWSFFCFSLSFRTRFMGTTIYSQSQIFFESLKIAFASSSYTCRTFHIPLL